MNERDCGKMRASEGLYRKPNAAGLINKYKFYDETY